MRSLLSRALFDADGARRLPSQRELDRALSRATADELFWSCETPKTGPLYVLPTQEFAKSLAAWLAKLAGPRGRILEVAAGDGFLSRALLKARPSLRLTTTDSGAWERSTARMTAREKKRYAQKVSGLALGPNVQRLDALKTIRTLRPDVVLAAWLPEGPLFEKLVRAPCRYLVEIGAPGVAGQGEWGWRFGHEFPPPRVEAAARSRLDAGKARRTRITCYCGGRHPDFVEERPRRGDWLWQFRPQ